MSTPQSQLFSVRERNLVTGLQLLSASHAHETLPPKPKFLPPTREQPDEDPARPLQEQIHFSSVCGTQSEPTMCDGLVTRIHITQSLPNQSHPTSHRGVRKEGRQQVPAFSAVSPVHPAPHTGAAVQTWNKQLTLHKFTAACKPVYRVLTQEPCQEAATTVACQASAFECNQKRILYNISAPALEKKKGEKRKPGCQCGFRL